MHHVCGIIIFVPGSKKLKTKNVFYFRISLPYSKNADVAELADAPDLGSGVTDVGVQVPSSAPNLCVELFLVPRIFYFPAKPNHPSPLARSLWKGLSPIKQSTGLFYLRLVFIRTKFMRGAIQPNKGCVLFWMYIENRHHLIGNAGICLSYDS